MSLVVVAVVVVSAAPAAGAATRRPTVLVLVPHSRWALAPPELSSYAKANLSLHTVGQGHIEIDGYLTVGKGRRAGGLRRSFGAGAVEIGRGDMHLVDWQLFLRKDRSNRYGGHLGSLGRALERAGRPWALVTRDPDAAAAAADPAGRVPHAVLGGAPDVAASLRAGVSTLIVETPRLELPDVLAVSRGACVIVTSTSAPGRAPHLGMFATAPECGLGRDGLVSASTRQPGYVTLVDVAPTFLAAAQIRRPSDMIGQPARPAGRISVRTLLDDDKRARTAVRVERPLKLLYVWLNLAGGALVVAFGRRARGLVVCTLLAIPAAESLMTSLPWWRWGLTGAIVAGGGIALVLAVPSAWLAERDVAAAAGLLAALGALVVGADAVFGGRLELDSPFANSSINAGRFSGVGNVPYGYLVAGLLVVGALALERWGDRAWRWVVAVLVAGLVVDGAPFFGADVGGVLAGVPAVCVFVALRRRGRVRLRRLRSVVTVAAVTGGALATMAAVDLLLPPSHRTHLGRAISSGDFGDVVHRKLTSAIDSFQTNPLRWIPVIAVVVLVVVRPAIGRRHALTACTAGLATVAVLGTFLNDSGVAVAAAVAAVGWPALVAATEARDAPVFSRRRGGRAVGAHPVGRLTT